MQFKPRVSFPSSQRKPFDPAAEPHIEVLHICEHELEVLWVIDRHAPDNIDELVSFPGRKQHHHLVPLLVVQDARCVSPQHSSQHTCTTNTTYTQMQNKHNNTSAEPERKERRAEPVRCDMRTTLASICPFSKSSLCTGAVARSVSPGHRVRSVETKGSGWYLLAGLA
eukprot:3555638-Rhodomonas_salina.1